MSLLQGHVRKRVRFLWGASRRCGALTPGKAAVPQQNMASTQQNMFSAAFCLLSIGAGGAANPAGCYRRSSHFPTCLLTAFLPLRASALTKACDQGSNWNPSCCILGFQSRCPGYLHFSFTFLCVCILCLSLVLIGLRDGRTPALALLLWLHKLGRFKHFGARFLQTCFFPERFSMIQLLVQLVSKAESILVMKNELAFIDRYLSSHSSHHNAPKSNLFIQTDWKLDPDRLHQKVCCHQELKTNLMEYETEF